MPLPDSVRRIAVVLGRLAPPYGPLGLPPPISPEEPLDDIAPGYAEFLRLADGAACGSTGGVRPWSAASVRQTPWVTDDCRACRAVVHSRGRVVKPLVCCVQWPVSVRRLGG